MLTELQSLEMCCKKNKGIFIKYVHVNHTTQQYNKDIRIGDWHKETKYTLIVYIKITLCFSFVYIK